MPYSPTFAFRDCPWCGVRDTQMLLKYADVDARTASGPYRLYSFVFCPRCAGPIVIETTLHGHPDAELAATPQGAFTSTVAHLPKDVERHYTNAIRVMDVPDAAAVQLRRTLEAATKNRGATKGSLFQRIQQLIKEGHVTVEFGQALDHVRQLGNVGAHDSDETLEAPEVKRAFDFTTQILRNLFEIPEELKRLNVEAEAEPATAVAQAFDATVETS